MQGALPIPGAYVGGVAPGSPAERAGLADGDIVTEFNMRPISSSDDLERAIRALSPGSRVSVLFLRGGKTVQRETVF